MRWADLSIDAKNVLEMMEGPNTGTLFLIRVVVGERPLFDGRPVGRLSDPIGEDLFKEMVSYLQASNDEFETLEVTESGFEVRIAPLSAGMKPAP